MSRLKLPWLVTVLLLLLWGCDLYETHVVGYEDPDAQEVALIHLDRTMWLLEELDRQPAWLRGILWYDSKRKELETLRDGWLQLHREDSLDETGASALTAILTELGEEPPHDLEPDEWVSSILSGEEPDEDFVQYFRDRMVSGEAYWWETVFSRRILPDADALSAGGREKGKTLLRRAIASAAAIWSVAAVGLGCLPWVLRRVREGSERWQREKARSYPWRWAVSLVIGVFLATELVANHAVWSVYSLLAGDEPGYFLFVLTDLIWRASAPVMVLLILFRKPRHAVRTLRLDGPPAWRVVFAAFALLMCFEVAFYSVFGDWAPPDPSGGLDLMEEGWIGLGYGLLSACVAAPVVEEIIYRGFLLRGLERRFGFNMAALASTVIFALGHDYDLYGLASVAVFGFAAAWVYRITGSLMAAILLHALFNLSIVLSSWWIYFAPYHLP